MIKVVKTGLYLSYQDGGRFGFRSIGVPLSGVMDRFSASFANRLLGNTGSECVLEFVGMPPVLLFDTDTSIAVTGAELTVFINKEERSSCEVLNIKKGDQLSFSSLKAGWRGYVAVKNGFQSQVSLKSQSQYEGVTERKKIAKGDILSVKFKNNVKDNVAIVDYETRFFKSNCIEVYKGPEYEMLSQEIKRQIFDTVFTNSSSSNRMAIILEEEISGAISEIITAPVQPGTIQLTPSGKLLILMRDAQTSGGYARVFQCSEKAINILAQKRPKEVFSFKLIS